MKWLLSFALLGIIYTVYAQNGFSDKKPDIRSAYHYGDQAKYYDSLQADFSEEYLRLSKENLERIYADEILEDARTYRFDTDSMFRTIGHSQMGVIGSVYRRIDIHISEVQATENPLAFSVKGKSKVGDNICDFTGSITLLYLYEIAAQPHVPGEGTLLAKYEFFEDSTQNHVGVFKGVYECDVLINHERKEVSFFDGFMGADGYANRNYVGTWQGYDSKTAKKCIWGDFRLPFTFDWSYGAGNMVVSKRYEKYGWKSYNEELHEAYEPGEWW